MFPAFSYMPLKSFAAMSLVISPLMALKSMGMAQSGWMMSINGLGARVLS